MPAFRIGLVLLLGIACLCGCAAPVPPPPSAEPAVRVFVARKILTMEPGQPLAEAVAVEDGVITAVGTLAYVKATLDGRSFTLDRSLADQVLLPGFIDNHLHPTLAAVLLPGEFATPYDWQLPGRTVKGVRGRAAYLARLGQLAARGGDDWLLVWGYHPYFHGALSREDLDAIAPERPLLVWHRSFHEIYVNSAGLAAWGITADAVAGLPGVELARGRFYERGLLAVVPHLARIVLAPERFREGLLQTRALLHAGGLTTVADPGVPLFDLDIERAFIQEVLGDEATPFRTLLMPNGMTLGRQLGNQAALAVARQLPQLSTHRVRLLPQIKLFADGAFYSQLMQMRDGYLDGHHGEWLMSPDELERAARLYWNAGFPIHVHVNGDLGAEVVLDLLARLRQERPATPGQRFTLHHLGYVGEDQVARIAELGAVVSANPFYVWALGDAYSQVGLGPERARRITPLGGLVRRGVRVSLHSDLTMAPAAPLTLASVAVHRRTAGGQVLGPQERLTVEQALRAVTLDAAWALGMETEIGSIAVGKQADFTVLGEDPTTVDPERLGDVPVWGTVFEGQVFPLAR